MIAKERLYYEIRKAMG